MLILYQSGRDWLREPVEKPSLNTGRLINIDDLNGCDYDCMFVIFERPGTQALPKIEYMVLGREASA